MNAYLWTVLVLQSVSILLGALVLGARLNGFVPEPLGLGLSFVREIVAIGFLVWTAVLLFG